MRTTRSTRLAAGALATAALATGLAFAAGQASATVPADGWDGLAFYSDRDGLGEIWRVDADFANPVNLTNDPGGAGSPAYSPDGSRIAFVSSRDGNQEIYVMNADGTGQTRLTNDAGIDNYPSWTPDGAGILFSSDRSGNDDIYRMNADGTGVTPLTNDAADEIAPAMSPDGSQILFSSDETGSMDLFLMAADGTGRINLTVGEPGSELYPDWHPTIPGRFVFQYAAPASDPEIYQGDTAGGPLVNLTDNDTFDSLPAYSPDGALIAYEGVAIGVGEVLVMNADGTGEINASNGTAYDGHPTWDPTFFAPTPPPPAPAPTPPAPPAVAVPAVPIITG